MFGWIGAAASIGSALIGSNAASSAADQQAQAAQNAQAQQLAMFNTQNAQLAPNRAAGYNALNQIGSMLPGQSQTYDAQGNPILGADGKPVMQTGSGYLTHQFNNQDLNAQLAPNYAFQLGQGQQANQAGANATGGLVGGNAMKGLQDYTQNAAGGAYQNAFNNYTSQRTGIYNTLAGIAGLGQNAQNTTANLAQGTTNAIGNLGVGAATAAAGGTVGSANAITGGLTGAANQYQLNQILGNQNSLTSLQNQISADTTTGNYSDRRLKTNIVKIGQYLNGLNKYSWTYLWGENATGAMADEVEKLIPEAIGIRLGYKTVNYALLGD